MCAVFFVATAHTAYAGLAAAAVHLLPQFPRIDPTPSAVEEIAGDHMAKLFATTGSAGRVELLKVIDSAVVLCSVLVGQGSSLAITCGAATRGCANENVRINTTPSVGRPEWRWTKFFCFL
jgi:hypothetical protein